MGVQYFFILSGFIFFWLYKERIENRDIGALDFSFQRFSRLYPLHIVTLILVTILQLIYICRENISFVYPYNDLYHFILNLFFASKWGFEKGWSFNAPIWSVSIEILLYVIFFITAFSRSGTWFFCLFASITMGKLTIHHPVVGGASMFFLGGFSYYVSKYFLKKACWVQYLIITASFLAWLLVILNNYAFNVKNLFLSNVPQLSFIINNFPCYILFPLTVICLCLIEVNKGSFLKKISWVGDITYSTYLLHFPLQIVFGLFVSFGYLNFNFYKSPISLIVFFSILISISYFTYNKFERPMQLLLRKKYYNIKAQQNAAGRPGELAAS